MKITIQKYSGNEEIEVKKLKCKVDNIVYYKEENLYFATDLKTGCMIIKCSAVKEMIEHINTLKEALEDYRTTKEYKDRVINDAEETQQTLF